MRRRAKRRPIVWMVDDERANREWFAGHHRLHVAVVTFSSRGHVVQALNEGACCDLVVTDVFFPARTPQTPEEERELLRIYERIEGTAVSRLSDLWTEVRLLWKLHGFDIASDVAEWAERRGEVIPVMLYSRKAPLLLSAAEWLKDPRAVGNTFWMMEKIKPSPGGELSRDIAGIQRRRIAALLSLKQISAPAWQRVAARLGINLGPFAFSLEPLLRQE